MPELHIEQESHGSYGGYIVGFILAVLLTAGAFWAAKSGITANHGDGAGSAIAIIAVLAVVQIAVHVVFFLHLNSSSNRAWNTIAFAYTVLGVVVLVFGTLWVMCNVGGLMMSRPIL
jgi:cytochrome o ubiquinol oxidase operon protein cyoD